MSKENPKQPSSKEVKNQDEAIAAEANHYQKTIDNISEGGNYILTENGKLTKEASDA